MRGHINDLLRSVIAAAIRVGGAVSNRLHLLRILCFPLIQNRLRRKYGINAETPVLSYGPELIQSIRETASKIGRGATFAETSGSTGQAKQILYTRRRQRRVCFKGSKDVERRACNSERRARAGEHVAERQLEREQTPACVKDLFCSMEPPARKERRIENRFVVADECAP